jgi:hypothetical protein
VAAPVPLEAWLLDAGGGGAVGGGEGAICIVSERLGAQERAVWGGRVLRQHSALPKQCPRQFPKSRQNVENYRRLAMAPAAILGAAGVFCRAYPAL